MKKGAGNRRPSFFACDAFRLICRFCNDAGCMIAEIKSCPSIFCGMRRYARNRRLTSIGRWDQIDDNLATNPAEKMLDRPGDHRDDRENQSFGQGVTRMNGLHLMLLSQISR